MNHVHNYRIIVKQRNKETTEEVDKETTQEEIERNHRNEEVSQAKE